MVNSGKVLALLLAAATAAPAATTVTIQLLSPGLADVRGFNAGPVNITIDGRVATALSYDLYRRNKVGDTWHAQDLSLDEIQYVGQFIVLPDSWDKYVMIGYLATLQPATRQLLVDRQRAMWSLFAPGIFAVSPAMEAYLTDALAHVSTFDTSRVHYYEMPNGKGQGLVVVDPPPPLLGERNRREFARPRLRLQAALVDVGLEHERGERGFRHAGDQQKHGRAELLPDRRHVRRHFPAARRNTQLVPFAFNRVFGFRVGVIEQHFHLFVRLAETRFGWRKRGAQRQQVAVIVDGLRGNGDQF
jgi:hypothetical protein